LGGRVRMRLIITSDLHYNVLRSKQPTLDLAEKICGLRADALLILGDAAGQDVGIVRECLKLFDGFAGRKFFVAGNHELWAAPGESSLDRYERILPEVCREAGFHSLDAEPVVLGAVGLVGCIGWYDYGFRPANLNIPMRFYEAKIAPGAASRMGRFAHLLASDHDVPPESLRIGTRWMDGEHVRLPMGDIEFCRYLADRLRRHLEQIAPQCDTIVAVLHHVPFRELVRGNPNPSWAFAEAYLGSDTFGEILLGEPKVRHAYCGHTHQAGRIIRDRVECINTGCTYMAKRYEVLEC
jgi:hypothetical protein